MNKEKQIRSLTWKYFWEQKAEEVYPVFLAVCIILFFAMLLPAMGHTYNTFDKDWDCSIQYEDIYSEWEDVDDPRSMPLRYWNWKDTLKVTYNETEELYYIVAMRDFLYSEEVSRVCEHTYKELLALGGLVFLALCLGVLLLIYAGMIILIIFRVPIEWIKRNWERAERRAKVEVRRK